MAKRVLISFFWKIYDAENENAKFREMLSIQQQGGILYLFFWEVYGAENIKKERC
jgi:hypothetical protein